jgi:hypothetical protein
VKGVAHFRAASTLAWHCTVLLDDDQRPIDVAASVPAAAAPLKLNVFIGPIEFLDRKELSRPA